MQNIFEGGESRIGINETATHFLRLLVAEVETSILVSVVEKDVRDIVLFIARELANFLDGFVQLMGHVVSIIRKMLFAMKAFRNSRTLRLWMQKLVGDCRWPVEGRQAEKDVAVL